MSTKGSGSQDTSPDREDTDGEGIDGGVSPIEGTRSPELTRGNDLTTGVFAFHPDGVALRFRLSRNRTEFVLPWGSSGDTVAGYVVASGDQGWPTEYDPSELEDLAAASDPPPEEVPLCETPAAAVDDDPDLGVSWHARVRWYQRIAEESHPGESIREAYRNGVSVGINRGKARFSPETGALIRYTVNDGRPRVVTVWPTTLDEVNIDHLHICPSCARLVDLDRPDECECCGAATCPDCGSNLSSSVPATNLLE